jgi:DsbC/DsbD-like thiol-disulfide interchange protein
MALPGTFIVDRRGRVTSRFFEEFYGERNTTETIMLRTGIAGTKVAGTRVTTAQLDMTIYPSDAVVAPGNRFSLIIDAVPHKGMHVYAPGAAGYRAVALSIAPQPFVRVQPLRYPTSEIYFFKPLNERVPVFQKPFRLVQEVVLEGTRDAMTALQGRESLTIAGAVDYQACDDTLCYNPTSVPVTWTLSLTPLIRERPLPAR